MSVFTIASGGNTHSAGEVSASSVGTSITASASANTKGSYTQLIASTASLSNMLILQALANTNGSTMLLDLAIGGAGSEQIILANLAVQGPRDLVSVALPIQIPGGVRLSARVQAATGSQVAIVKATLVDPSLGLQPAGSVADCYGQNTGTSRVVSVDPGGTANTKGSYSQIVASTTRRARGFIVVICGQGNTNTTAGSWLYDVAIGGAGSEQIILADWFVDVRAAGNVHPQPHSSPFIPIPIGSGTRIAVRSQSTVTDATDRLHDVQIIAIG